jgi:membrane-bound lytic murein transglycosylase B
MQFIPSTWRKWASDGNGDGLGDPQQIDDAALAAARYLCAGGRDMASPAGWWAGILSYNNSTEYAQKVFGLADGYAKAAQSVRKQG